MRKLLYLFIATIVFSSAVQSQIITTIAGVSSAGNSGDGGPAVNAELNMPGTIAFDVNGNLLIGDGPNGLKQVDAKTGIITMILPESDIKAIAVDSHNDIYYAYGSIGLQVIKIEQAKEVWMYTPATSAWGQPETAGPRSTLNWLTLSI